MTWWCSHDVDSALADYSDLEYTRGLFDFTGHVESIAATLAGTVA